MRPSALARLAEASGLAKSRVTGGPCVGSVQPCLRVVPLLLVSRGAPSWGLTLSGGTGSVVRLAGLVPILAAFLSDPLRQLLRSWCGARAEAELRAFSGGQGPTGSSLVMSDFPEGAEGSWQKGRSGSCGPDGAAQQLWEPGLSLLIRRMGRSDKVTSLPPQTFKAVAQTVQWRGGVHTRTSWRVSGRSASERCCDRS